MLKLNRRQWIAATGIGSANCWMPAWTQESERIPNTLQRLDNKTSTRICDLVHPFMQKFKIPGLSLAIAVNGKLKITGGFGFADKEAKSLVKPTHRFRVASVSKPLTSTAVMKLVESGKLSLDERVFGIDGILKRFSLDQLAGEPEQRKRIRSITVRHLLEHACGGWGNREGDPMFTRAAIQLDHDGLIQWTLNHRPLQHTPGTNYQYSNFGYCLVGRIIEQRTGMNYQAAVQSLVLTPAGVKSMQIGGDTLADRAEGEVKYYGQNEDPYHQVMRVSRMDAPRRLDFNGFGPGALAGSRGWIQTTSRCNRCSDDKIDDHSFEGESELCQGMVCQSVQ